MSITDLLYNLVFDACEVSQKYIFKSNKNFFLVYYTDIIGTRNLRIMTQKTVENETTFLL